MVKILMSEIFSTSCETKCSYASLSPFSTQRRRIASYPLLVASYNGQIAEFHTACVYVCLCVLRMLVNIVVLV